MDTTKTHKLPLSKVSQVFSHISRDQVGKVFRLLNTPENSEINYAELIYFMRGKVSQERNDFIVTTFDRLDLKRQGEIPIK
jgi:Ca2+-binding EF-hand superfamily protein